jgi:hypothetical protein
VLTAWVRELYVLLGMPDRPLASALSVLFALRKADRELTAAELAAAMLKAAGLDEEGSAGRSCPDCGLVHDLSPLGPLVLDRVDGRERHPIARLADYGALAWADAGPHGMVWLTALGRMLATSVFAGFAPHPGADAATVMEALWQLPPPIAHEMARPWLAGRSAADAVRGLLTWAAPLAGSPRGFAALAVAELAGPDGADAWREWAGKPGFGVYARVWLSDNGEPVPEHPLDGVWLNIDETLCRLAEDPDQVLERFEAMVRAGLPVPVDELLAGMLATGHPGAPKLVAFLVSESE